ncbi:DNA-binding domain-containing protein [Methylothermus subterraneus]
MNLAQWQRRLQAAIVEENGAVSEFKEGLAVYRNAYRLRLIEALAADYPKLSRWLGEERFARLALDYVAAYPSRERSLRWVGRRLPEFLQGASPWQARPELAEMALFEWALGLAFDCADAEPLAPLHLAQIPIERWPALRLKLHPSVQVVALAYPVPQVWKALAAAEPPPACLKRPSPIPWLVWRQGFKVFFRSLAGPEHHALQKVLAGGAFAEVCEELAGWDLKPDVARYAVSLLWRWLEEGLVVAAE